MKMTMRMRMAGAIAAGTIAASASAPASAGGELVIATFGGSFAEDTKTCHVAAFEAATGAKAILTLQFGRHCGQDPRHRWQPGNRRRLYGHLDLQADQE